MKQIILLLFTAAIVSSVSAQNASGKDKEQAVQEIRALLNELNAAIKQHDKEKLEKIYADEFLFIHGLGFIDTKTEQISTILETDSTAPVPLPSFDHFFRYGDVAILRAMTKNPVAGNNLMSTTIYARRNNGWQIVQIQSTQQQRERDSVIVEASLLDTYVGNYIQQNGSLIAVSRQDRTLFAQRRGRPKLRLIATANSQFFDKFGTSYTFVPAGKNSSLTLRAQNGQETSWSKVQSNKAND